MSGTVDLYDSAYAEHSARLYREVREETYDLDLGQTGWMTGAEFRSFFGLLTLSSASRVLEVGCGAGGCAVYMTRAVGAEVTGIDVNENGVMNARALAQSEGVASRVRFELLDASRKLPFADDSFDAVFSNDAMCHVPHRPQVLEEWLRVLKPGGRMLFTDAMIVTGILSNQELATRSSIGQYFFVPPGENERFIREAGMDVLDSVDVTESVVSISERWRSARARRCHDLTEVEGEANFLGLQKFLACVHKVSEERRLSRYLYLGRKPARSREAASTDTAG